MDRQILEEKEEGIIKLAIAFCDEHLDEECAALCTKLVHELGDHSSCPLQSGKVETWAAAVVYTICSVNLLFGNKSSLCLPASVLSSHFGYSKSYMAQKSREIKSLLKIDPILSTKYLLKENVRQSPLSWLKKKFGFFFNEDEY